ncbi:MAG: hypothetical protein K1X36_14995 [Pyrinomonadaceae bacterium]|nr:hypothetical protein [Pyrinomonadaceae bacterium]
MAGTEFEIPLTEDEMEWLGKASKQARDQKPNFQENPNKFVLSNYWSIYLELLVYQGQILKAGKKKGTHFVRRRTVLQKIRQILGRKAVIGDLKEYFPADTTMPELLQKVANDLSSL